MALAIDRLADIEAAIRKIIADIADLKASIVEMASVRPHAAEPLPAEKPVASKKGD